MIPRLKPYFDFREIKAIFRLEKDAIDKFEKEFARTFKAKYALSFPYGRSAIYALFKCLGIEKSEIIVPAYTCVVVPHAIVLSGNIPRFVDTAPNDFNLNLEEAKKKINEKTKAIITGNIFGYPVDTEKLKEIKSIKKDILVIQDCAHCF
ncbi:MAG: DegT/DnrJ/EryC1/StrS family aminotransferase, partial [Candidatus Pacebacteria bacterium]|nr:DegT/DnrJ/EryC1/StrS family aminotransferase [Candidatus Paceibacterota bacterium]